MNKRLHFCCVSIMMLIAANLFSQIPASGLNFEGPVASTYDRITVADAPSLDFTTSFTFETWVNFDFLIRNDNGYDWQCLFAKSQFNASYGLMYLSDAAFPRGITFYHAGFGTGATTYRWPTIASNTWYHVAVTLSPTKATIYVDGEEVMSQIGTGTLTPNNAPLCIGANDDVIAPYPLNATLEETRFWNVTRTQAEIQANMIEQIDGNTPGLVLQFSYNQGNVGEDNTAITAVTDTSTEGNTGTLNQFALTGTMSNFVDASGSGIDTRLAQNITFGALAEKTTDDPAFQLMATSNSGLPITYTSSNLAVATVSGDMLTIVGGGSTTITASQLGNATYRPAAEVLQVQQVILGATDPCAPGNDSVAPSFTNIDGNTSQTVVLDATGSVTIAPERFGITAIDNCTANPVFSLSQTDFTCANIGTNTLQLIATDAQGNASSIEVMLVIQDTPPVITTDRLVTLTIDSMNPTVSISLADLNASAIDDCELQSFTLIGQTNFSCEDVSFRRPPAAVDLIATDNAGQTSTAQVIIVVRDGENPTGECIAPFTVVLDVMGHATIAVEDVITNVADNCGIRDIRLSQTDFTCADIGNNLITATIDDTGGNTFSCSTTVTVVPPSCPGDLTLEPGLEACGVVYNYPCASTVIEGPVSGSFLAEGTTTTFTYEVPNSSGGVETCNYTVTVEDSQGPAFSTQNQTLILDEAGTASLVLDDLIGPGPFANDYTLDTTGAIDRVDISSIGTQVALGDDEVSAALPIGFEFAFYGNLYTEFYISSNGFITFSDDDDAGCCGSEAIPNSDTPNNLIAFDMTDLDPEDSGAVRYTTIGTAPNRIAIIDFDEVDYFDVSSNATTSQLKLFEGTNRIEIHSVSSGISGNGKTQGIENKDGTAAITVPGRNADEWTATNEVITFTPVSNILDGCGVASVVASQMAFNCSNIGANTITITAIDINGNVSMKDATVTVVPSGATAPVITIIGDNPQEIPQGSAYVELGATTNDGSMVMIEASSVDVNSIGSYNVIYTARDLSCNAALEVIRTVNVVPVLHTEDAAFSKGIRIYPNPVYDIVTIKSDQNVMTQIRMVDISGRVMAQTLQGVGTTYQMDVSNMSQGVYFLEITSEGKQAVKRIVKH